MHPAECSQHGSMKKFMHLYIFSCAFYIISCGFRLTVMRTRKIMHRSSLQSSEWTTEWAKRALSKHLWKLVLNPSLVNSFWMSMFLSWTVTSFSAPCHSSSSSPCFPVTKAPQSHFTTTIIFTSPVSLLQASSQEKLSSHLPGGFQSARNTSFCCCVFRLLDMTAFVV